MMKATTTQRPRIPIECADYNLGFCEKGPNCHYIHKKKGENDVSILLSK